MFEEKDYEEENVREVIYFQGIRGRMIKKGTEEIDIDWTLADKWLSPIYGNNPVRILAALGLDEDYLDGLNDGDVVVFEDSAVTRA